MSVEESLRVFDEIEKAVNARDWNRFDELHAESVVDYSPQNPEGTKGIDAHRESMQNLFGAFPDARVEKTSAFGQGEWAVVELTFAGTHTGPLMGPGGQEIPPTNKAAQLKVCSVNKVEGGKIAEEHTYFDQLTMLAQLGITPEGD
ncbi:MAG: ester cyclase [Thermoplasmata archaeon]